MRGGFRAWSVVGAVSASSLVAACTFSPGGTGNAVLDSSSGTSSSTSSTSSSASSGGSAPEDCLNGVDDDLDGATDCDDSDCAPDYECVPMLPINSVARWVTTEPWNADLTPPPCPDGSPATVVLSGPATTAECAACECSYAGATCASPTGACWYDNDTCSGDASVSGTASGCVGLSGVPAGAHGPGSCSITAPPDVQDKGSCSGGASSVQNAMWSAEHLVCAPAKVGGACKAGVCATRRPMPTDERRSCVEVSEGEACPSGYPVALDAFDSGDDQRVCTDCGCDVATVTCSGGGISVYDDFLCSDLVMHAPLPPQGCMTLNDYFDWSAASASFSKGSPNPGVCKPSEASGAVVTTGPHRYCCTP